MPNNRSGSFLPHCPFQGHPLAASNSISVCYTFTKRKVIQRQAQGCVKYERVRATQNAHQGRVVINRREAKSLAFDKYIILGSLPRTNDTFGLSGWVRWAWKHGRMITRNGSGECHQNKHKVIDLLLRKRDGQFGNALKRSPNSFNASDAWSTVNCVLCLP